MDIRLITRHLDRRPGLIDLVQRRAGFAFARFADLIGAVEIRLTDVNGPRGGSDIACLARVRLVAGGDVIVETTAPSPEAGAVHAINRLSSRLRRLAGRNHDHR
jgi:putative sigma-54 modulation protein